jgi:hypothetical protein
VLRDASVLAARLEAIDRAVATPQLRSLSGLSIPINRGGIDVHNMSTSLLGRSLEWNGVLREVLFTDRAGAPPDAIRLYLYVSDSTSRPAYPPVEIGYADLYPHNTFNGGGPDSMSLRFVLTDTRTTPTVVADFIAHSHADSTCQCATVEGWASDGTTRVDFRSAYNIPVGLDGQFPGTFNSAALGMQHFATLPGPGVNTATANLALVFGDDSIRMTSGLLTPRAGRLEGSSALALNGEPYAVITRSATGTAATGPGGGRLGGAQLRAASALFAVPADIAYYVEWPVFVIFFCGC